MEGDSKESQQRTVRFREKLEQSHHDVENNTTSENPFRVPQLPVFGLKKKKEAQKSPLKTVNNNAQMQISPGTSATDKKQAAVLARLEKRRNQNRSKWEKQKQEQAAPVMDLGETERSFLDQSFIPPPRPSFSNMSMIQPTDTFIEDKSSKKFNGLACSTPRRVPKKLETVKEVAVPHPATPRPNTSVQVLFDNQPIYESHEDIAERQFKAICDWCNTLLNTCNHFDDGIVDLGKTKQDATKKLQELLSKNVKDVNKSEQHKFTYKEFLRKQEFDVWRKKAHQVYSADEMPQKIVNMVQMGVISIRDGSNVYSDLTLKTTLLRVFLSFHPVWLHLGMETIFGTTINVPDGSSFLTVMTRFINSYLYSDPEIMQKKKYAIGTVKLLVTPEGRVALHRHFLTKACQFFYCVEKCKTLGVIPSDPRLFVRKGQLKSLTDVFSEISREVLSASGTPLNKAFSKLGFTPKYKQNYFDDLEYKINSIADLNDGVNLGKLVEVACNLGRGAVMSKLRNPGGDRLRKIGNVSVVLDMAVKAGVDLGQIKPEAIVAGNMQSVLEVMWKIIGVFVLSSDGKSQQLRKETKRRSLLNNSGQERPDGDQEESEDQGKTLEQFVMDICQSLGISYGITISCFEDLKDGILLSIIWRDYNKKATDIHFYEGKDLFKKIVNAAVSELDIPAGLHFSLPLFVHQFLSRVFEISRLNEAATRIQKAYKSYRFFRALRAHLKSEEYRASRRSLLSAPEADGVDSEEIIVVDQCQKEQAEQTVQLVSYDISKSSAATPKSTASVSFNDRTYAVNHNSITSEDGDKRLFFPGSQDVTAVSSLERSTQSVQFNNLTYAIHSDNIVSHQTSSPQDQLAASAGKDQQQETEQEEQDTILSSSDAERSPYSIRLEDQTYAVNPDSMVSHNEVHQSGASYEQEQEPEIEIENITASTYLEQSAQSILPEDVSYVLPAEEAQEDGEVSEADNTLVSVGLEATLFDNDEERLRNLQEIMRQCEEDSATAIQKCWRAYIARKKYIQMRNAVVSSVVNIQKLARGAMARTKLRDYMESYKTEKMVIKLQSYVRQFLARRKCKQLMEEKEDEERKVIIVQSCVRRFLAKKSFTKLLEKKEKFKKLFVILQSHIRCFLAKKKLQELRQKAFEKKIFEKKVLVVQNALRRQLAEKQAKDQKFQALKQKLEEELIQLGEAQAKKSVYESSIEEDDNENTAALRRAVKENAAVTIQKFFRRFVTFKRFTAVVEELAMKRDYEKKVIIAQSIVRRFLAMRKCHHMKEAAIHTRQVELEREQAQQILEQKVILIQSLVRGFLARQRVNRMVQENIAQLEEAIHETSAISPLKTPSYVDRIRPRLMETTPSTPELLRTLRRLRKEINEVKTHNAYYEKTLNVLKGLGQAAEGEENDFVTPPRRNEQAQEEPVDVCEQGFNKHEYMSNVEEQEKHGFVTPPPRREPTDEEKTTAAVMIQKFWRGHKTRKAHKDHIVKRRSAMQIYREDIERIDDAFDAKSSAYKRLEECTEWLFHSSMYKHKVAAFAIERIIKLSSHLCNYFVLNCDGLSAVLDRMEQGDRSPGESEIISYLCLALDHIIRMALSQPAIERKVSKYTRDILKILFHKLNAFHNNARIVVPSVAGIVGLKKISVSTSFEKAKYYISQADKRYNRLRNDDPLKLALEELKQWYN